MRPHVVRQLRVGAFETSSKRVVNLLDDLPIGPAPLRVVIRRDYREFDAEGVAAADRR
jgi:hypothetical protein